MMKIDAKMINPGADIYYDKAFRDMLESHLPYLRTHVKTRTMQVDPQRALVYEGDLFGYLLESHVDVQRHWVTMRTSGFFSPHDFTPETLELLIPDGGEIESLRQAHTATGFVSV
jgi:hypothetical protein